MILEIPVIIVMVVILTYLGIRLAPYIGLLDKPSEARKQHIHATPAIGGVVVFISFVVGLFAFYAGLLEFYTPLILGMGACVILGMFDDIKHIRALTKMLLQVLIASFFVVITGMKIHYLGDLFGTGAVGTRWFAIPFTVACIVILMNAINWIDGLDGLSSGVLFSIFGLLIYATYGSVITPIIIVLMAAVFGFLLFNMRNPLRKTAAIFFGDAGSLGLGFALSWFIIYLTQLEAVQPLTPMVAVWIIAYPCFDMMSSIANRIIHKRPLHCADNMHAHFLIQNLGISVQNSSYILVLVSTLYGLFGIFAHQLGMPEFGLLISWCLGALLHFMILRWLLSKNRD